MKLYLKVIGCSCYTCLPQTGPAAAQAARTARTARTEAAPGTGTPQVAQRLLTSTWTKTTQHKHTSKQD